MAEPATELFRLSHVADVPEDAWKSRLQWTTCFKGVAGLDDKFMHLSTAEQIAGTAAAYFAGRNDVMLLRFSVESMVEEADLKVRWESAAPPPGEKSRDGEFPHVYGGPIPFACLAAPPALLALDADGKHVLPSLGPAVEADIERSADEAVERGMDDEDGYDGGAARGMWG